MTGDVNTPQQQQPTFLSLSPSLRALPVQGNNSQGNNHIVHHLPTQSSSPTRHCFARGNIEPRLSRRFSPSRFFFLLTTAAFTEHKFRLSPALTPPQSSLFRPSFEALLFSQKPISFQLQLNMQRALSSAARARPSFSNMRPLALASSPLSSRQQSRAYSHKVSALILI